MLKNSLSVVIPCFNREKELRVLLNSILNQKVKPFEVIIIDDHSFDNQVFKVYCTFKKIYLNKCIILKYYKNEGIQGTTISKNLGVKNCAKDTDIIGFLDSDVELNDNFFLELEKAFIEHKDALGISGYIVNMPSCSFFYSFYCRIFNLFRIVKKQGLYYITEYPKSLSSFVFSEWLSGGCSFFRKEVFKEFKHDENLKEKAYGEDVLFSHQIFQKHPFSLIICGKAWLHHYSSEKGRRKYQLKEIWKKYKYIYTKLFGFKGFFIAFRKIVGLWLLSLR